MHRLPCIPVFFYAMAFSFTLLVFHLTANSVVQCKFWEIFKNKLNQLIKEHVPHKIAKVKDSLPWINTETKKLIRKRYRLYKKMKKNGDLDTKKKLKKIKHYSMWPKVLQHVKKSLYNQPKPYFFKKFLLWSHFWIDFNKFYIKTFRIVYILIVYLLIMFIWVVFICT